jgi:hypothetical protein
MPNLTDLHLDLDAMQMSEEESDPEDVIDALVSMQGTPRLARVVTSLVSPEGKAKLVARFGSSHAPRR